MAFAPLNEQMDLIRAGTAEILPEDEIAAKIERSISSNNPLTIKLGCDPSRPDLHIGHAVVLRKLRQFQDLGHQAILIVGDFTGMIGDPTGKSKTRAALTLEETRSNGQTYFDQASQILDTKNIRMVFNSEWLSKLSFQEVIVLSAKYTVAQMLERDDFSKRFSQNEPISIHEFMYPLAQAMDSVAVASDIELGGTDQKFNLIVGREIQKAYGLAAQGIVLMPILEGTDGVDKMSKSLNNYIALHDSPREMFGKVMSIPDALIARYYELAAWAPHHEAALMKHHLIKGDLHPRNAKVSVAKAVVALYHGHQAGEAAFEEFERIFVKKDIPDVIDDFTIGIESPTIPVIDALVAAGLAQSKSEARRLIQQGGLKIDGEKWSEIDQDIDFNTPRLFQAGKRRFLRVSTLNTKS